jgi:hypothetical protein
MNQILTKQIQLIYTPKVIPWRQTDKQTNGWMDGQIFTQYSGISSHSLMGVWILSKGHLLILYHIRSSHHSFYSQILFDMIQQLYHFDIRSDERAVVTCYPIDAFCKYFKISGKATDSIDTVFSAESFCCLRSICCAI